MYIIINKIADHYSLGDDITKIIMQYVQRNLLNQGWKSMKSFDKSTQKIVKMKKKADGYRFKDELQYECFNTIHNLYMENPTNGYFKLCNHYFPNLHTFMRSEESNILNFEFRCFISEKVKYERKKQHKLKTNYCIEQLRAYIENTQLFPKLKKSLKKNQLINIILHNDPDYKLPKVISPRESSRNWIMANWIYYKI